MAHKRIRKIIPLLVLWLLADLLAPAGGLARSSGTRESSPAGPQAPQQGATVSVNPQTPSVSGCDILEVYIDVNNVSNLYALDVRLTFDPAVLEVVDFTPGAPVDLEPFVDPGLQFIASFTVRNVVDNFNGTIWYAATQTYPKAPAAGSGHVARIRLRAKSTAVSAFNFTYAKLSNPNGVEIPTGVVNGSVSASTAVAPSLAISRLNASQVRLSWPVVGTSSVSKYHLYRSSLPYFYPADPAYYQVVNPGSGSLSFDDSVLGNVTTNYFYTLRAECTAGGMSASADQVGKFEYMLYETADTDYAWVALPLNVTGITTASSLANHIENNSDGAVNVLSVSRWNPVGQSVETYDHVFQFGDFAVALKFAYRVEIDIPSTSAGTVIWAQVGKLPAITYDTYTLHETADTDYTWVMQPLEMTSVASAASLANHIQANASAPAAVLTVGRWNGTGQSIEIYDHQINFGNFATRFGYPYQIEINVNSGFTVTWP